MCIRDSQCIVVRLSASQPGALNGRISSANEHVTEVSSDEGGLLVRGRNVDKFGIEGRLRFAFRVHASHVGGSLEVQGDRIAFQQADEVVLRITAATSFVRYDDASGDPEALTLAQSRKAAARPYADLLADHLAEHRRLFRRVAIDLGRSPAADQPTDERIKAFAHGHDPALVALYHQYGRYPVSYTHLDVYKRQVLDWSYWPENAWGSHDFDPKHFPCLLYTSRCV